MTTQFYEYEHGSNVLAASGHMHAFGDRILCKAILKKDSYKGPLTLVTYTTQDAIAFEVISMGAGVKMKLQEMGEKPIAIGDHIEIKSVAADRVNGADATGRFWLVPVSDVVARFDEVPVDDRQ